MISMRLLRRTLPNLPRINVKTAPRLLGTQSSTDDPKKSMPEKLTIYPSKTYHKAGSTENPGGSNARISNDKSRGGILTLPNVLTLSRIAVTPAIGYFMWNGMYSDALNFFMFAAATDFLDGGLARLMKQESHLGTILDPIADKLLLTTCLVAGFHSDLIPIWYVKGLIMRDVFITIGAICIRYTSFREKPDLRKFFDVKNHPSVGLEPVLSSKICTALQCIVIVTHLTTYHMVGGYLYDWFIVLLQIATASTAAFSSLAYVDRIITSDYARSKKPRRKL